MSFINHLENVIHLRNRYIAVRHGESEANVAHLISSHPEIGCQNHGLSPFGQTQVKQNARLFLEKNVSCLNPLIFSSDFRRARETAEILASTFTEAMGHELTVQLDPRLRERFFGIYDGQSDENYSLIWRNDQENLDKNLADQVESVESVRQRTTALIKQCEDQHENRTIFLVSHGDSLQILQTAFERLANANKQRDLPHLERAEFRTLILK